MNIEGNPIPKFKEMVLDLCPDQVTLVPDAVSNLTSDAGWDTIKHKDFLSDVIAEFKSKGIRTSIFVDPVLEQIQGAAATGADRIELYTESFARAYEKGDKGEVAAYSNAARLANELGLGLNAGHDLSLDNIEFFVASLPNLAEVSIGHALISESLYLGFENVIGLYLSNIQKGMQQWK